VIDPNDSVRIATVSAKTARTTPFNMTPFAVEKPQLVGDFRGQSGAVGTGIDHEVIRSMAIDAHCDHQVTCGVGCSADRCRVPVRRDRDSGFPPHRGATPPAVPLP